MCDNKIKIMNTEGELKLISFTCSEVKNLKDEWIEKFKSKNFPEKFTGFSCKAVERFEEALNSFILSCKDQPERLSEKEPKG